LNKLIYLTDQLNFKFKFSHPPKGTTLRRTVPYDLLNVKIGPASAYVTEKKVQ